MKPEGVVKAFVKAFLAKQGLAPIGAPAPPEAVGLFWMPVPYGYGASYLDFVGHYKGFFFGIETKAAKGKVTKLQEIAIGSTNRTGGKAFVVRCTDDLKPIGDWFREIDAKN